MYVGRDFSPVDPGESELFGFDFINDLPPGDTISAVSFSLAVEQGEDPNPTSHLDGLPGIDETRTQVFQRVNGLISNTVYVLRALAVTAQGNSISMFSRIPSQPVF